MKQNKSGTEKTNLQKTNSRRSISAWTGRRWSCRHARASPSGSCGRRQTWTTCASDRSLLPRSRRYLSHCGSCRLDGDVRFDFGGFNLAEICGLISLEFLIASSRASPSLLSPPRREANALGQVAKKKKIYIYIYNEYPIFKTE